MKKIIEKIQEDLEKELKKGKYHNQYLIYNRKSTDEPDNQKNSIRYQKSENIRFAQNSHLSIAPITIQNFCKNGVISERHSGFKEDDEVIFTDDGRVQYKIDRPKFQIMLSLLNKGYFKGIICLCWDRVSRNKADNTIIDKLMRRGLDFRFVYARYDDSSSGELHKDIDGMFAQHRSRVTSEKVKLALKNARDRGVVTYRAPIGYLNQGSMENKPLDPKRAPIIKNIFKLYATGAWSLSDLTRYAKEQGMKTIPMRKRRTQEELLNDDDDNEIDRPKISRLLTSNMISRILNNPFYIGKTPNYNGEYITSISHEPLIDEQTFIQVQANLKKRCVSVQYDKKLDLPLRGAFRCGECNRVYTPYVKKGIQYYGARCRKGCSNTLSSLNFEQVTTMIGKGIEALYFSDSEILQLDKRVTPQISYLEKEQIEVSKVADRKRKSILEKITYLDENKLDLLKSGVYSPEDLTKEVSKLKQALSNINEEEKISGKELADILQDTIKLSELLKTLSTYYYIANAPEKELIIRNVFSELSISQNALKYKVQNGLECLQNRFDAVGDPKAWLSELSNRKTAIHKKVNDLENLNKSNFSKGLSRKEQDAIDK